MRPSRAWSAPSPPAPVATAPCLRLSARVARFEMGPEGARMVRVIFAWVGLERVSLREIYRRLQQAGVRIHRGDCMDDQRLHSGIARPLG